MKKLIIFILGMTALTVASYAEKYMQVEMNDGTIVKYYVDEVNQVTYGVDDVVLGQLPGKFSVSENKQVSFSKGNLQYQASSNTWRFAQNQYDVIGRGCPRDIDEWVDLLGWGTSGYNNMYPCRVNESDYYKDINMFDDPDDISGTDYDWGQYNAISNGGNKVGMWRTLTAREWEYIFNGRDNAGNLRSRAVVNGVNGYVLLPDSFILPSNMTFVAMADSLNENVYDVSQWHELESIGAVFLPFTTNYAITNFVEKVVYYGGYWSSTAGNYNAYGVYFHSKEDNADVTFDYKWAYVFCNVNYSSGCSVRLVSE